MGAGNAHPENFEGFGWMRLFVGIFVRTGLFLYGCRRRVIRDDNTMTKMMMMYILLASSSSPPPRVGIKIQRNRRQRRI